MRILLDENMPRDLKRELPEHEVSTVREMGWAGIKNGTLLRLAQSEFQALITIDQKMIYQHNVRDLSISIIVLETYTNRLPELALLTPRLLQMLKTLEPGSVIHLSLREQSG